METLKAKAVADIEKQMEKFEYSDAIEEAET